MRFDDGFDEAQAQPVAVNLRGGHFLAAIKRFEDVREFGGRNSQPVIFDDDLHLTPVAPADRLRADTDPAAFATDLLSSADGTAGTVCKVNALRP